MEMEVSEALIHTLFNPYLLAVRFSTPFELQYSQKLETKEKKQTQSSILTSCSTWLHDPNRCTEILLTCHATGRRATCHLRYHLSGELWRNAGWFGGGVGRENSRDCDKGLPGKETIWTGAYSGTGVEFGEEMRMLFEAYILNFFVWTDRHRQQNNVSHFEMSDVKGLKRTTVSNLGTGGRQMGSKGVIDPF